uniref:Membrane protein n=1 Tax=Bird deltacoronavirus HKU19 TaxID=3237952 RepID=A0AB39AFN7_9NIDO
MSEAVEWQLIVFIILIWALGFILQGGYAARHKVIYVIKLILLWLLQPFTLVVTIWTAVDKGDTPSSAVFIIAIIFAILTLVIWLKYWYDSIRLVIKTKSGWSFSPETRLLVCAIDGMGNVKCAPVDHLPTALTPVLVMGRFMLNGQLLMAQQTVQTAPRALYVMTPSQTYHFTLKKTFQDPDFKDTATFCYLVDRISKADLQSVTTGSNYALYKHL